MPIPAKCKQSQEIKTARNPLGLITEINWTAFSRLGF